LNLNLKVGKFKEAAAQFERGLQLQKEFNDLVGISYTLAQPGDTYTDSLSDLNTGLKYHQECLNVTKGLKRSIYAELSMEAIAQIYKIQGKIDQALEMFQEVLDSRTKRGACNRASVLTQIGSIHYLKGDLPKALEFYRESLQLCEKAKLLEYKAEALNYLGEVYTALGNYEKALTSLEEGLQLKEKPFDKAEPLTNIAEIYYRQGKLADAMAKCEESLAFSRQFGGRIQAGVTLHLLCKIRLQEQRYADALQYVQEAVTIFKETSRRRLPEAEATLKQIQASIEHQ
jgi:tetratricopeptide (TPR) repeat protein